MGGRAGLSLGFGVQYDTICLLRVVEGDGGILFAYSPTSLLPENLAATVQHPELRRLMSTSQPRFVHLHGASGVPKRPQRQLGYPI